MKFNVVITGIQDYEGQTSGDDKLELTAEAEFYKEDGKYFIEYDEELISDCVASHTKVEIGKDYVSMHRSGDVRTEMLFMLERQTSSLYDTPYGSLQINIYTSKIENKLTDDGGTVYFEYIINADGRKLSRNSFDIKVIKTEN